MSPEETLRRVIEILEKHKISYMLTGSVAASYHGRPRATHDADVVIDPTPYQLDQLIEDPRKESKAGHDALRSKLHDAPFE